MTHMDFERAIRIVKATQTSAGMVGMSTADFLEISRAQALLANHYVKIDHLLRPGQVTAEKDL